MTPDTRTTENPGCLHVISRKADRRTCSECGTAICADHVYIRVDESNASITRNSPPFREDCANRLEPRIA